MTLLASISAFQNGSVPFALYFSHLDSFVTGGVIVSPERLSGVEGYGLSFAGVGVLVPHHVHAERVRRRDMMMRICFIKRNKEVGS